MSPSNLLMAVIEPMLNGSGSGSSYENSPCENVPVFNRLWHESGECSWRLETACRYSEQWFYAMWDRI